MDKIIILDYKKYYKLMILVVCKDSRLIYALECYYNYQINVKLIKISYNDLDGDYKKIFLENYIDLADAILEIDFHLK